MSFRAHRHGDVPGATYETNNPFETLIDVEDDAILQEVNETLKEPFPIPNAAAHPQQPPEPQSSTWVTPTNTTHQIRRYMDAVKEQVSGGSWLSMPELPTSSEVMENSDKCDLANKIEGAHNSNEKYLSSHYELQREDAIRPLRHAVQDVKGRPSLQEAEYSGGVGIYSNVYISACVFSPRGLAVRVSFSLSRIGKRIRWEQSKRLITGTLVALTPADDMFKTTCILATVAARPLAALEQNPPEIDLFFASPMDLELDPTRPYCMVEDRSSFFEASRHTMLALQKLMREPFPLSEYLVGVKPDVEPPLYVLNKPHTDLSSIVAIEDSASYENVNILEEWPDTSTTGLDKSQSVALRRILTKRLAIVQGPPGTGKTYVSVIALKALIANWRPGDPPIILTCQTNHALDQLLRHIHQFAPEFIRLGGRSKDEDIIKKRTLFEVRMLSPPNKTRYKGPAIKGLKDMTKRMQVLLSPLEANKGPIDHRLLATLHIIDKDQAASLEVGIDGMEGLPQDSPTVPMEMWMGHNLKRVARNQEQDYFEYEYEDIDLDFEELQELEAEAFNRDDDDLETLRGPVVLLGDNYTGARNDHISDEKILSLLAKTKDLYRIPSKLRGSVYCYFQKQVKELILAEFRNLAIRYDYYVQQRRINLWENDNLILKEQKIIGMTTTGLSKYRALVESLNPRIILVEEAAETLEAPIIAACLPSLEHLILVGDHQQLRPHTQVRELEGGDVNFDMSLFERMVHNEVEYDSLQRQRRMIPEIRRLLRPIYGKLISDHKTVLDPKNRPPIPGMGGCNSFFFTHDWPETHDANMSACNPHEADMLVGLVDYLVLNGVKVEEITILTFYNGQRKLILRRLMAHPNLTSRRSSFKVVTVDSYQGEENDIVLLSLVRSNDKHSIGFLNVNNRVCVALSRAKRGFYLFGNGLLLCQESKTWAEIVEIMYGKKGDKPKTGAVRRVGFHIPLECTNHSRKTWIEEPGDWESVNGGCEQKCRCKLPCGHTCMLMCHPFDASDINCTQKCLKVVETCGHPCSEICVDHCRCAMCEKATKGARSLLRQAPLDSVNGVRQTFHTRDFSGGSDPAAWTNYAKGGVKESDAVDVARAKEAKEESLRQAEAEAQDYRQSIKALTEENAMTLLADGNDVPSLTSEPTMASAPAPTTISALAPPTTPPAQPSAAGQQQGLLLMTPPTSATPEQRQRRKEGLLIDVDSPPPRRIHYRETFDYSPFSRSSKAPERSLLDD
ncbi:P-loop containing nucleoside triphosphate hydrolase protein [Mytilinidion resinicola]|uniref:P-loop containing nucleoside triphosphate hydrolase protein n=1 Tax=Mytilinidion resinicola TaxID=574789 RepID=A0A6A6Y378_9PEZI|nr:P-loop containing nucleoside triphosphate hydrolase protein [Mytilinidion resinicola]KAF2803286.1 P-loop containing nucleoside triphosphate hydrolase protein [Mytilinidion resinicola]